MLELVQKKQRDWPSVAADWRAKVFGIHTPRHSQREQALILDSEEAQEAWIQDLLAPRRRRQETSSPHGA